MVAVQSLYIVNGGEKMQQTELESLIEEHYQSIYAYCYRHVGQRELAQDLTQMTFLRLWQGRGRYNHDGRLLNYLYTIAGNLCRDWFRSRKNISLEENAGHLDIQAKHSDLDFSLMVREALAALSFEQRNTAILYYYHGFTAAEISRITKVPVPTVRYRLHRAVKQLQTMLKEDDL